MVEYRTTERVAGIMHRAALQHAYALVASGSASSSSSASSSASSIPASIAATAPMPLMTDPQDARERHAVEYLAMANTLRNTFTPSVRPLSVESLPQSLPLSQSPQPQPQPQSQPQRGV